MATEHVAAFAACTAVVAVYHAALSVFPRQEKTQAITVTQLDFERLMRDAACNQWFVLNLRCSRNIFLALCSMLRSWDAPYSSVISRRHRYEKKVATSLYFFASSGSYRSCAAAMGMSKATVVKVVDETIATLLVVMPQVVSFPQTSGQWISIEDEFCQKRGFPGVVGAIDAL